ncbi:MAG: hypothetical protein ACR2LN_00225 [Candidatus Levyibacteriota bacterium]
MAKQKHTRNQIIRTFTQYGVHIWAILIIANSVMVYAYQFSTHAAGLPSNIHQQQSDSPTSSANGSHAKINAFLTDPTKSSASAQVSPPAGAPSPEPSNSAAQQGPLINLSFSVPGIGSGGGNMKPLHPKRNVIVFLYATNVNSIDPNVKPLYTIRGNAAFDTNINSPTYTSFINPSFDLGSTVNDGDYQLVFRTDQSLRTIVKDNPTDVGGKALNIGKKQTSLFIPLQTVLMGDTIPDDGDNVVKADDYNAFINCYGEKNNTTFCKGKNYGDFDDNGQVDGIDYNILLRSLAVVQQQGLPIPQVAAPVTPPTGRISKLKNQPTSTPTKPPKPTRQPHPAANTQQQPSNGGSSLGGVLFLIFLIVLGAIGFIMYKKNEKLRNMIRGLIHLSPTGQPGEVNSEAAPSDPGIVPTVALGSDVVASSEIPASDAQTSTQTQSTETPAPVTPEPIQSASPFTTTTPTEPPSTPTTPASNIYAAAPLTSQTAPDSPPPTDGAIEKECYVKKKGPDEAGTGQWLLLTDDNGPVEAHYAKNDAADGFAKVKGVMKTENGKTFLEISELTAE